MSLVWQPTKQEIDATLAEMDYQFLQLTEDYEHQAKQDQRDEQDVAIFLICAFGTLVGLTAFAWVAWKIVPWIWDNALWLWNSGPQDSPWIGPARWGIVTGLACVVWCCAIGAYEWWTKDRR